MVIRKTENTRKVSKKTITYHATCDNCGKEEKFKCHPPVMQESKDSPEIFLCTNCINELNLLARNLIIAQKKLEFIGAIVVDIAVHYNHFSREATIDMIRLRATDGTIYTIEPGHGYEDDSPEFEILRRISR